MRMTPTNQSRLSFFSCSFVQALLLLSQLGCVATAHAQDAASAFRPIRVNVGGSAYTDSAGNAWSADSGFNTGSVVNGGSVAIAGTSDPRLFRSGRRDPSDTPEMQYTFKVPNGTYGVKLYFAESDSDLFSVGSRTFSVEMEGRTVLANLDIYARVGANAALVTTSAVTVTDGELNIGFVHGVADPIVSAIEILAGTPQYEVFQTSLRSSVTYANPFSDVEVTATFTAPSGRKLVASAFYDGENTWRARIAPDEVGKWSYSIDSSDVTNRGLSNKTGTFDCIASTSHGFIRPDATTPYWFSYSDGTPFFGVGDTAYSVINGVTDEQRTTYFNARAAQKFNFIRFFITDSFRNAKLTDAEGWAWGGTPSSPEYDQLNPQYFQRLESILGELKARGMHAEIAVFNYYSEPFTDTDIWTSSRQDLWAQYVISRLSAYDTVFLWTVTNEYETYGNGAYRYENPADDNWARSMGALFHRVDPHEHPTTVHNFSFDEPGGVGDRFGSSKDIDVLTHQEWGAATWNGTYRDGNASGIEQRIASDRVHNKPVINTENGYEWLSGYISFNQQLTSTDKARRAAWRVFVGGGAAYAAGFAGTFQGKDDFTWKFQGPLFFQVADSGLGEYVSHFASFVPTTDFRNLSPEHDLVSRPNSCLANAGQEYVVYAPSGGAFRLDLSSASGTFAVVWFNPRTGAYRDRTTIQGGSRHTFTSPDTNDWVLHVKKNN
jgi:Protein of unknown function (DUF4038)/Malectin domain/Domain of unknown function (DUF5060)/Putative collagen-binding domain of a collagenase